MCTGEFVVFLGKVVKTVEKGTVFSSFTEKHEMGYRFPEQACYSRGRTPGKQGNSLFYYYLTILE